MKLFSSKRRVVVAAAAILLILFLLRPGASRLKSRISGSISAALARPVEVGSVHLRLLPRPGFDVENLVVYDDPAFGAEPMLRASEVTASLRLTALAHGRIEIARLDLTEPSLNLVRGKTGRWNLEALLERTAQTPLAPTGNPGSGSRPGFPYIEAGSGRINFKNGPEKKPYALTNADFALWQDSENSWGVRLKAQPFRSDMNLSDTGILRVNGTWQRAASLRETALQFSMEWDRPQLGQLTKFFTGDDMGWRGAVLVDATLTGTPARLQVSTDASIRDFRRYDVSGGEALRLAAHCDAQYSSVDHEVHELFCLAPVGTGSLTLHGSLGLHQYDLAAAAQSLPADALAALAQRIRKSLPEDLNATGSVAGTFFLRKNGLSDGESRFTGQGEIAGLRLTSARNKTQIVAGDVGFALTSGKQEYKAQGREKAASRNRYVQFGSGARIEFGPFAAVAGRSTAPLVRGWIDRSGYGVSLAGDMDIARTLEAARLFGVPAPAVKAEGMALMNLQVSGSWWERASGTAPEFPQPQVTGTAKLRNVRAELRGVDGPLELASAELLLTADQVQVTKLTANAAHTIWTGRLQMPRGCGTPSTCLIRFDLNTNQMTLADLSLWVSPRPRDQPWYRSLTATAPARPTFLATLRASGKIVANRVLLREVTVGHVSADLELEQGKLHVSELRGDILGGKYRGEWNADFTTKPVAYTGSGTFTGISLGRAADAMADGWIAGTASGSYQLAASGSSAGEFWQSAKGTVQYEMVDGLLPHISLVRDAGGLKIERFEGRADLRESEFEIKDGRLDSPQGMFAVNGTVSLQRELDLRLTRSPMLSVASRSHGYTITGTLAEPQVLQSASGETQARLKPAPSN